jgi:hypothetical protein
MLRKLLLVERENNGFENPFGFVHLFCQLPQGIAVLFHDLACDVHLPLESRIVVGDPQPPGASVT